MLYPPFHFQHPLSSPSLASFSSPFILSLSHPSSSASILISIFSILLHLPSSSASSSLISLHLQPLPSSFPLILRLLPHLHLHSFLPRRSSFILPSLYSSSSITLYLPSPHSLRLTHYQLSLPFLPLIPPLFPSFSFHSCFPLSHFSYPLFLTHFPSLILPSSSSFLYSSLLHPPPISLS